MRLFVDRVRDVQPGFTLDSQNAAAVAELCRRLDGLPLALELAAASMRLLTPDQILARLSRQLERPGALADLPGRQQTLTGTIQWSYDLLPAPAQQMLARLSVFAAPFTAAAAEAVGGQDDRDAVEDLSTLLDHSMVSPAERPDGQRAFRLLDPIRRFAAAQLDDAGADARPPGALSARRPGSRQPAVRLAGPGHAPSSTASSRTCGPCSSWIDPRRAAADQLLRALGGVWVWLLVRGHLRQSAPLWQQIDPAAGAGAAAAATGWRAPGCWPPGGWTRASSPRPSICR